MGACPSPPKRGVLPNDGLLEFFAFAMLLMALSNIFLFGPINQLDRRKFRRLRISALPAAPAFRFPSGRQRQHLVASGYAGDRHRRGGERGHDRLHLLVGRRHEQGSDRYAQERRRCRQEPTDRPRATRCSRGPCRGLKMALSAARLFGVPTWSTISAKSHRKLWAAAGSPEARDLWRHGINCGGSMLLTNSLAAR